MYAANQTKILNKLGGTKAVYLNPALKQNSREKQLSNDMQKSLFPPEGTSAPSAKTNN
jgi:hypothetical protein